MTYRFGDFEVDTDKMELRREGTRVATEPQVFALLSLLIENRNRLVTKDEIIAAVWAGRIVSESALSSRIKSVRRALGDSGTAQRWVRTIHGRGFRFVGEVSEVPPAGPPPGGAVDRLTQVMSRPMVAVFPFEQEGADPDEIAEGLAEDLTAELASWRWFPILSRNAAFDPQHRTQPIIERAARFGARYAIGGRVRRTATHARLGLELIDVETGAQLWSARFESGVEGLRDMQAQIAAEVFSRIAPELNAAERRKGLRKPAAELTSWDMSLKALGVLYRPSPDDFAEALEQLETATRLDPADEMPWNLTALIRYEAALKGWSGGNLGSVRHHLREMRTAALKAVAIDPNGWLGHALASCGHLFGSSYVRAHHHADRALDLNPSAGLAHQFSGCIYGFGGDLEAAGSIQSQAFRIDPDYINADVIEADLGLWRFLMGDHNKARAHFERSLTENPENVRARQRLVALLGHLGDKAGARAELERLTSQGVHLTKDYLTLSYPFQRREHFEVLSEGLARAGVEWT
jgi:DNA-binding winged helix-turn-helix (wHTH) protein/TolB-like protein/Flp pilus assembly protein TadD